MDQGSEPIAVAAGIDRRGRARRLALRGLALCGTLVVASTFAFGFTFGIGALAVMVGAGIGSLASFLTLLVANAAGSPRLAPQGVAIDEGTIRLLGPSRRS